MSVSRRTILKSSVALATGSVSGVSFRRAEGGQRSEVPDWMRAQGRPILSSAYGETSKFERDVVRRIREPRATDTESFSVTPLHGIITPSGLVFERHHVGVPEIAL